MSELPVNVESEERTGEEPSTTVVAPEASASRAVRFARRHPALTLMGVAGAGLVGGFELAAGVVIGAGVMSMFRTRNGRAVEAEAHAVRERARNAIDRVSPEIKKRARAVVQAARGQIEPKTT